MRLKSDMFTQVLGHGFVRLSHICFAFILVIGGLISSSNLAFSQTREFTIVANPQPPHKFEDNGNMQGIDIDIIKLFLESQAIPYKVSLIRSDKRLLREMELGRAEMMLLLSKNAEREVFLDYPAQSYIDITWNFFIRKADEVKFTSGNLADLQGFRVGATQGISYTDAFWDAGLDLSVIAQNDLQIPKLLKGRIDVVPLNTINTLYDAAKAGYTEDLAVLDPPLKRKSYFNVFSKASDYPNLASIRADYDRFISDKKADGTIAKVFQRYLGVPNMSY